MGICLINYAHEGSAYKSGALKDGRILSFEDMGLQCGSVYDCIFKHGEDGVNKIRETDFSKGLKVDEVEILSPFFSTPHDIICVGLNYQAHKDESQSFLSNKELYSTTDAVYFSKRAYKITGPYEDIEARTDLDDKIDYECELAIVIGKQGRDISEENALDHVFGYTIVNDLSSRTFQKRHGQWYKGKSLDGYTVMGPGVVPKSEIMDVGNLNLKTWVNGELRQDSNTKYMMKSVSRLIYELSQGITLVPGDIIATGTPEGVGQGFNPPKWLKKGDVIEMEIDGIGKMRNRLV
ncbi:MAG: fumarylacetoacetate hydrolase family protein [Saccharofermentanales bacterium]|jgi:2-keto-4-pentenoate hydratase/2-oxohepta-3-ene-1,7-dioic acid hydratase in catechol pathway|nr:fumarylacetoacetate hydrolase family protein [Clostridiaceae bacterium]